MAEKKYKYKLTKPKITLDRFGQVFFTLREAIRLAMRTRPKLLVLIIILNGLWGFLAVPGFYLEKMIIDRLFESIGVSNINPYLYSIGLLVVLALLLSLIRNFLSTYNGFLRRTMARYFEVDIEILLGKKLAELDMATIDDPDFQDKFKKIEAESGRRSWGLVMPISDIPNYLVGFVSALGILLILNPFIALGVFIVALPQIFIDSRFIKKEYELNTQLSPLRRMWGWLGYYLVRNQNFMELKLLGLSSYLSQKMRNTVNEILTRRVELQRKRAVSRLGSFLPLTLFEFLVSIILILWVITQKITVGSFQLYLRSLRSAEQNLTSLVSSFLEIYENYIYVSDLVWFLNLEPIIEKSGKDKLDIDKPVVIEFKDVWFKYRDEQPWVVKGVSFTISPGERIALLGVNGAGKSTLIKLLARFYDPQKGKILVNGKDIKTYSVDHWRENLAILFQQFEGYIFSARESIGFGDISRLNDLESIKKVARETEIDEFIERLPLKYENPLTPRFAKGIKPSAGQRQRIGISRVLFREKAKLLVLDEPTSNVDPEAEEKIFKRLVKRTENKILLFITQRFSTVKVADRIFVMDGGKLIEQGTHNELMKLNKKYAKLYNIQAEAYLKNDKSN